MKCRILSLVAIGFVLLLPQAQASIITFDNFGDFVTISNQYAGVVFSAGGGDVVVTHSQNPPYRGSAPNIVCTAAPSVAGNPSIDCTQDFIVTFTAPVDGLSFDALGNQTAFGGTFAIADIYQNNVLSASVPLLVSHFPDPTCNIVDCNPDLIDLSAYSAITQLVIRNNTDNSGTAYDNFAFTAEESQSTVPEPSMSLLIGIAGVSCLLWRRRSTAA